MGQWLICKLFSCLLNCNYIGHALNLFFRFGRRPTFLIGTLLQFVFLALSGLSNGPVTFATSMFIAGGVTYVNYVTAFVIGRLSKFSLF